MDCKKVGKTSNDKKQTWLSTALEPRLLRRSLTVSAIVGTILMIINHGDVIFLGHISMLHVFKIALTYLVPFMVSTYSGVASKLAP
ncbi:MAG: nitrate/nitrite transporter NrtS [Psychrobium sp.]|nr:nitrate/nitrite transporter NrtS [Psychrobium sp.]